MATVSGSFEVLKARTEEGEGWWEVREGDKGCGGGRMCKLKMAGARSVYESVF